jgi:hypothetical protein
VGAVLAFAMRPEQKFVEEEAELFALSPQPAE